MRSVAPASAPSLSTLTLPRGTAYWRTDDEGTTPVSADGQGVSSWLEAGGNNFRGTLAALAGASDIPVYKVAGVGGISTGGVNAALVSPSPVVVAAGADCCLMWLGIPSDGNCCFLGSTTTGIFLGTASDGETIRLQDASGNSVQAPWTGASNRLRLVRFTRLSNVWRVADTENADALATVVNAGIGSASLSFNAALATSDAANGTLDNFSGALAHCDNRILAAADPAVELAMAGYKLATVGSANDGQLETVRAYNVAGTNYCLYSSKHTNNVQPLDQVDVTGTSVAGYNTAAQNVTFRLNVRQFVTDKVYTANATGGSFVQGGA